jgi:hypothetical protein
MGTSCPICLGVSGALYFWWARFFIRLTVSVSSPASVCTRRKNVCEYGRTTNKIDIGTWSLHRD